MNWTYGPLPPCDSGHLVHCTSRRQTAQAAGNTSPRIPWLLSLAGDAQDFSSLRLLCMQPELLSATLEALGILGAPAAVPLLVEHLEHDKTEIKKRLAMRWPLSPARGSWRKYGFSMKTPQMQTQRRMAGTR